jgi:uncharacterized membrane protein
MAIITTINLILCVIILLLGLISYMKKKHPAPLYIGIAFGLFGVSHLASLLGLSQTLESFLIGIRTLAYLIVLIAVYKLGD